jgi:hypothetical protein
MKRINWVVCFILLALAGQALAQETMTKITMRAILPAPESGSIDAKPRTLYRSGFKYARAEGMGEYGAKVDSLMVCTEPDIWIVNLADRTGRHEHDPEGKIHLIIWSGLDNPKALDGFEYGMEFEFFKKNGGKKLKPQTVQGVPCDVYSLKFGAYQVLLFAKSGTEIPVQVEEDKGKKHLMILAYDLYQAGLPLDKSLFQLPKGVRLTEVKAASDKWEKYDIKEAGITLLLPEAPVKDKDSNSWTSAGTQTHHYSIIRVDLDNEEANPKEFLAQYIEGIAKSVKYKVTTKNFFKYKGFPAYEINSQDEDNAAFCRGILVKKRFYMLICEFALSDKDPEPLKKFLESADFDGIAQKTEESF